MTKPLTLGDVTEFGADWQEGYLWRALIVEERISFKGEILLVDAEIDPEKCSTLFTSGHRYVMLTHHNIM